ncbi:carboxypeptidase M [Acrasis kona]|uniref:Carboxypeptidase M n=1 Tax=Acrasis kona TaxID=1008807 RepID=A0AAW2Z8U6_9EUKA
MRSIRLRLLLVLIALCSTITSTHDYNKFDVTLVFDPQSRSIAEEICSRVKTEYKINTEINESNIKLHFISEKQIDFFKNAVRSETKSRGIHSTSLTVEDSYKTSESYKKYMSQTTSSSIKYHNYDQLGDFLTRMNEQYPDATSIFSIGQSAQSRELRGLRINTPSKSSIPKPKFRYVGNMHGDEVVGREMLIQFTEYVLTEYYNSTSKDYRVKNLLDSMDMYVLPSMNPDGYELKQRENVNYQDLNRDFPDQFIPESQTREPQPETRAIMNWFTSNSFVLGANFHGGAVVASYPFDGFPSGDIGSQGVISKAPDHDLYVLLARTYADNHKNMMGPDKEFPSGITNGAQWYSLYGGMQDYGIVNAGCPEITMELSDIKSPPEAALDGFWNDNKLSLLAYAEVIYKGVGGLIYNNVGERVNSTCLVTFSDASRDYKTTHTVLPRDNGFYYRVLYPGSYDMTVKCEGSKQLSTKSVVVNKDSKKPTPLNWMVGSSASRPGQLATSGSSTLNVIPFYLLIVYIVFGLF